MTNFELGILQGNYKKRSDRVKGFQILLLIFSADGADDISVMGDVDLDNDHAVILFSSGTTGFPKVFNIFLVRVCFVGK